METLIEGLRTDPPKTIGESGVRTVKDYREGVTVSMNGGKRKQNIDLPRSNVLQFILEDDSIVTARPSGTEPKVKFYASSRGRADEDLATSKERVRQRLAAIQETIDHWVENPQG
jgi:phosphoglucomutase